MSKYETSTSGIQPLIDSLKRTISAKIVRTPILNISINFHLLIFSFRVAGGKNGLCSSLPKQVIANSNIIKLNHAAEKINTQKRFRLVLLNFYANI